MYEDSDDINNEEVEYSSGEDSDLSENESENQHTENVNISEWSVEYDKDLYNTGIAVQNITNLNITVLQWLALHFNIFSTHPSISKQAFSSFLKLQSSFHKTTDFNLPASYYEARKLINPYVIKRKYFHACVNDCVLFRDSEKYQYANLQTCPLCSEDRYVDNNAKRQVARRKFIYIPIGPRLARIYGEVNLAQLVQSHPGCSYSGEQMWDIHHSAVWKELYGKDGHFSGDNMGISFAFEMDGVNPYHNIGVCYSMTPMMLTILNLPRHIRNTFSNINLVGIIPGSGRSEATKVGTYVEVLVDELLYLTGCKAYSEYNKAPVDVKIKLLLYVLDYPGLSKLFNQIGSGGFFGCHWCFVRGETCKHLDKVVYLHNRSFLEKYDPLRDDDVHFVKKESDHSEKPQLRTSQSEVAYRKAYEQAKNKTQAAAIASATGCKASYPLSRLPDHNRLEESLPDACHVIKDVVQNVMNLVSGRKVDLTKIANAESKMNRMHIINNTSDSETAKRLETGTESLKSTSDGLPAKRRRTLSKSRSSDSINCLPFVLTKNELHTADERAQNIRVPVGFGLKPSPFIGTSGCLKSHDWKQLASEGVLKYCLKDLLSKQCRETLFNFLDSVAELCKEEHKIEDIDSLEIKLNKSLAFIERDFPISLQNITTHVLHHIPDGIRKYGPIYGTWMYVFERFNSWICKRCLNMRYPEATASETFIIYDWCQFMFMSGRIPAKLESIDSFYAENVTTAYDDQFTSSEDFSKRKILNINNSALNSIHKLCQVEKCVTCSLAKYHYHEEKQPITHRVYTYRSSAKELQSAKTVSSIVCVEFARGPQSQKILSGKFVHFGEIMYFAEHKDRNSDASHSLAYVRWFADIKFDHQTKLWHSNLSSNLEPAKYSFVLTNRMSHPLVTAINNGSMWFINSKKVQMHGT